MPLLILLDRDGVLNRMVIDPEHGTVDSPLHPDQVEVFPWVPEALALLNRAGYGLAIVSNQSAAVKGKTTLQNLQKVHERVLSLAQSQGGVICGSYICFHCSEDGCACRKPRPGLLEEAFLRNPGYARAGSWMVGDSITDMQAGLSAGLNTAFLGPRKCDICKIHEESGTRPLVWFANLFEFATYLLKGC